jgi:ABC-2 type transport system ATP-binding protein
MADDRAVVISVQGVHKTFKLPNEKQSSLKGALINFRTHKKGFEQQLALDDVSFEVHSGDFFGIVGRNGSGKSTLLKLLAGIYSPTKGTVTVNGKLTPFIELGVGFNPELTGRENVYLNGALLGFNRKKMTAMYDDIVHFAELGRFMDQKLKNYSSGMQVRLAFSIAIRAQSDILLLDEVLAVGDAAFQQKCYDYFEELRAAKKTVVFVSHDMGAVRRFCNRAIYIDHGKVTYTGSPMDIADVYQEDNMQSVLEQSSDDLKLAHGENTITVAVTEQKTEQHSLKFKITYGSKFETYIGFSLIKDGATFAELNSLELKNTNKKGVLEYELDTQLLNAGLYEISATLIKAENRQPLSITPKRAKFNLSGSDRTRGGAIYLKNTLRKA